MRVGQSNTTFGAREFVSQRLNNTHLDRKFKTPAKNFPVERERPVVTFYRIKQAGKRFLDFAPVFGNRDV